MSLRNALGLLVLCAAGLASPALAAPHPLDPLSAAEIRQATAAIQRAGFGNARIHSLEVLEPAKDAVLGWQPRDPISGALARRAFAVVRRDQRTYELSIELGSGSVQSREMAGVQPGLVPEEYVAGRAAALNDRRFVAGLLARGVRNPNTVLCWTFSAGTFVHDSFRGRRVAQVQCSEPAGTSINPFARPLTGLSALVDLDAGVALEILDTGAKPLPRPAEFETTGKRSSARAFQMAAADQTIGWEGWTFHWRIDPRVGLVISTAAFDGRPVLYQGSLSEVFVPYMDADPEWNWRTFLDAGEYGFGRMSTELQAGIDCPEGARFFDATVAWPGDGRPQTLNDAVCVFERDANEALWRHMEELTNTRAGRARFDLVLRQTAELGLYSYTVDWVFGAGGDITVEVIANGIDGVRAATEADTHGRIVAPGLVAPAHDHHFAFRLDTDVDGTSNRFVTGRFALEKPAAAGGRSVWVLREQAAAREHDAIGRIDLSNPATWRIENSTAKNGLGQPTGYALVPGDNILPLVPPDDPGLSRGGFAAQHVWVTPYQAAERYAAGAYPNQSAGGGLPQWTAANRAIADTDLVLWYTMGFRHVPAPEDWPVLSARKLKFSLVPFGFFDRNPAVR